ncbi:unnamed protein product [Tilletia controversa]|uniref:Uncharacterized protein n=3 Tax=Tilletia TaxID=13289 RepID=A0A8X7MMP8_9BASI|nr:hypothetical protein CF336_g6689 [Tilletia laevis]KAE8189439.1 hypothetical protein CF328_g6283 [Tilletia controversa]KAE8253246.1 hypothetical protein A4X03_0g5945 [Tilletia caries]KAE8191712.1 hypothetical protein CF335_g6014 [Tilletia laevis]KAE8242127.1 hypothetical protein A4X06_0g7207 [Tilletia controversa]
MQFTTSALLTLTLAIASVSASLEPTAAPAMPIKRDSSLPTGAALNSIFSGVIDSYSSDFASLRSSITKAGIFSASQLRAGTATRTKSNFVSGTAASCILPSVASNTAYCCPGGDIIDGVCYANGSGQFVDSTYFQQNSFNPPTSTASNNNKSSSANPLIGSSGVASMAAMGAAALIGAAVLVL